MAHGLAVRNGTGIDGAGVADIAAGRKSDVNVVDPDRLAERRDDGEGASGRGRALRKGWAVLSAAVMVGSTIPGGWERDAHAAGKYDNMEYLAEHLPPGILNCRDRAIRILYAQEVRKSLG